MFPSCRIAECPRPWGELIGPQWPLAKAGVQDSQLIRNYTRSSPVSGKHATKRFGVSHPRAWRNTTAPGCASPPSGEYGRLVITSPDRGVCGWETWIRFPDGVPGERGGIAGGWVRLGPQPPPVVPPRVYFRGGNDWRPDMPFQGSRLFWPCCRCCLEKRAVDKRGCVWAAGRGPQRKATGAAGRAAGGPWTFTPPTL